MQPQQRAQAAQEAIEVIEVAPKNSGLFQKPAGDTEGHLGATSDRASPLLHIEHHMERH